MEDPLGFKGTKEDVLKIWEKNAQHWFSAGPPWRPSAGDIKVYQKLCDAKITGNVLILGSTSELRDFVAANNEHLMLVDVSLAMLAKMGFLSKRARPNDEIWIKSDWCKAPLKESYFDLVIGDMVWWVISVDYQFKLRDKIVSLLKPDGLFVSRFRLREENDGCLDPSELIQGYLKKFENDPAHKILIRDAMMSRLYDITADVETKRLNRERTKAVLSEISSNLTNPKYQAFLFEAASQLLSADWTSQTQKEILSILEGRFQLVSEMCAGDYESEHYPIFSFVKKQC